MREAGYSPPGKPLPIATQEGVKVGLDLREKRTGRTHALFGESLTAPQDKIGVLHDRAKLLLASDYHLICCEHLPLPLSRRPRPSTSFRTLRWEKYSFVTLTRAYPCDYIDVIYESPAGAVEG